MSAVSAFRKYSEIIVYENIFSFYGDAVDDFLQKGALLRNGHIIPEIADFADFLPHAVSLFAEETAFGLLADQFTDIAESAAVFTDRFEQNRIV